MATLNVRTSKSNEKLLELEETFTKKKLIIFGISEVRRRDEKILKLNSGHTLLHTDCENYQKGVGFLVHKYRIDKIIEFNNISNRIAMIKIKLPKAKILTLIQENLKNYEGFQKLGVDYN